MSDSLRNGLALLAFCLPAISATAPLLPRTAGIDATALDASGFIYVAGTIVAGDLPVTPRVFQPTPPADCPASTCVAGYLAKVAPSGDSLIWATYFFMEVYGTVTRIAVGKDGNLYVARSSPSNPALPPLGGYQSTPANIFIAEFSSDGKTLLAETYFAGAGDTITAIQLDAAGSVYLAGTARSPAFPTTPGAYQRQPLAGPGGTCSGAGDGFVAKFDGSLKTLVFSTLVGSAVPEVADAFALGADGSLYLTATRGFVRGPCWDATLTRLKPDASAAIYSITVPIDGDSQFFGGYALAVDANGFAYVGGDNRQFIGPPRGSVLKFDSNGVKVASQAIGGSLRSLAVSGVDLVAIGSASVIALATTPKSPPACVIQDGYDQTPYVARMNSSTLEIAYAGFLPSRTLWLAGPDQVLASYPYAGTAPLLVVTPGPPAPGTVTCLANAATYVGYTYDGFQVAPGEIVSLFGSQIGDAAGVQILIGGLPAPILYAAPDQINLVVPFALASDSTAPFELRRSGSVVARFSVNVVAQHPGLFTLDSSGIGQLAALNQDGSVNRAANPAEAGTAVVLFATGLGAMTPQRVDGTSPPQAVNHPVTTYQAEVYGVAATIEYIGNAPTLVEGVVQINVRLPNPVPSRTPGVTWVRVFSGDRVNMSGTLAVR